MAEKKSGNGLKWFLGCGGVFLVSILICAGAGYYFIPKIIESAGDVIADEMARDLFASGWHPPASDITDDELFPDTVGTATRIGDVDVADIPDLNVPNKGRHAQYNTDIGTVDVLVYNVTDDERQGIYMLALNAAESNYNTRMTFGAAESDRLYIGVSSPAKTAWFWWKDDWLIVTTTDSKEDTEPFLEEYLDAIASEAEAIEMNVDPESDLDQLDDEANAEKLIEGEEPATPVNE